MSNRRHIVFLINPISGTSGKGFLKALIQDKCSRAGISFACMDTRADGDYAELRNLINAGTVTDVVICGGDGSINKVASAIGKLNVTLGIVPLGSGNGLALAAGIPRKASEAVDLILKAEKSSAIDGFWVNDKFSCMLTGVGFDAAVAHAFAKEKKRGLLSYVKLTIREFFTSRPYSFSIETNNSTINCEAFFISIANSNQFGNHVTIAPRASLNDGLLDIVVVKKSGKLKMILSLLHQIKSGRVMDAKNNRKENNILYFHSSQLIIHNPNEAPLHIDGDPEKTSRKLKISIIPKALTLWVGK